MDMDGYPTDEELETIRTWGPKFQGSGRDIKQIGDKPGWKYWLELMEFIHEECWYYPDWGWHEEEKKHNYFDHVVREYNISTGGWSGNEEVIMALRRNFLFWTMCWEQTRRGGHYIFQVDLPEQKDAPPKS